jgi:protein-S-isoprenylcysteine O-methyltransferase Ste14
MMRRFVTRVASIDGARLTNRRAAPHWAQTGPVNWLLILPPIWAWILLELFLGIRDVVRRKGSPAADRGTRALISVIIFIAYAGAIYAAYQLDHRPGFALGLGVQIAGEVVAWAGLAIRIWAVVTLGASFRLTVEVDSDQKVVDRGPYRWVRHPSYTGLLLIALGFGLALGNWVSLLIMVLVPPIGIIRRIGVEETTLVAVMGQPYADYRTRTKRIIPGIW